MPQANPAEAWHQLPASSLLQTLGSSATLGLSSQMAQQRLAQAGPNTLPEGQPPSRLGLLLAQFHSLPVVLLAIAAGICLVTGSLTDALVILGVVAINAAIGFVTELHSDRIIRSLQQVSPHRVWVLRDGQVQEINAAELVLGDILQLRPGSAVAADARLLAAEDLTIDESALTGESLPVSKQSEPLRETGVPLGDRANMVYQGTGVTGGQGQAVVVATGAATELGQIQALATQAPLPQTRLGQQLNRVGTQLAIAALGLCGLVFSLGLLRGYGSLAMLKTAIALAVAAVPEGLPAIATTTLAVGIQALRRQGVLVRRLDAIETLGAVQVLCLDKTGTLTTNQMAVVAASAEATILEPVEDRWSMPPQTAETLQQLLKIVSLCNEASLEQAGTAFTTTGSPTERALLDWAIALGTDVVALRQQWPRTSVQQRAETRNLLLTVHRTAHHQCLDHQASHDQVLIAVKGNPQEVLERCSQYRAEGRDQPLSSATRALLIAENERLAERGLRMLGVAYGEAEPTADLDPIPLTWLGLVGLANPIRPGVKTLLAQLHGAGIEILMLTGDQQTTAMAIGQALNLQGGQVLQGLDATQLGSLSTEALQELISQVQVFARISPATKLQIVQALQQSGKVVAMTGDGINDAPALKAAAVGIAMGEAGTPVAQEVADVVLADDNLATLTLAISQGRTLDRNIRKAVWFLLATNLSEVIVTLIGTAIGLSNPLTARQLLWLNLITDVFPALGLALEPAEPEVMQQSPHDPTQPFFSSRDWGLISFEGLLIASTALAGYGYGLSRYGPGLQAGTLTFMSLVLGQLLHTLSCRSSAPSLGRAQALPSNPFLAIALGGSVGLQCLALVLPGLRALLQLTPLSLLDGLVIGGCALLPVLITEVRKSLLLRPGGQPATNPQS